MSRKNNLSPLPFHLDLSYQNQNNWYSYGKLFSYNYEVGFVPPFQLVIEDAVEPVGVLPSTYFDVVQIYNEEYEFNFDVKDSMVSDQGLTAEKFSDGYVIVKNKSTSILNPVDWNPLSIPNVPHDVPIKGNHYLKIVVGGVAYCSEIFTWKEFSSGRDQKTLKLKYSHNESFNHGSYHIDYSNFEHIVNLPTTVGKPLYEFNQSELKRQGVIFPTYQVSYKKFRFEFFASEYLLDALRVVRMHDFVEIENDGETFIVNDILFTVTWLKNGNLAHVVCEFVSDTSIVSTMRSSGNTDIVNPPPDPPPGPTINGDYNNDYNSDYFNL